MLTIMPDPQVVMYICAEPALWGVDFMTHDILQLIKTTVWYCLHYTHVH